MRKYRITESSLLMAFMPAQFMRFRTGVLPGKRAVSWLISATGIARMGVMPTGLHITAARTRWGSCSGKNSLCFSLFLMRYPPEAIDAVVVHELAHIRHKNHGPDFYRFVEKTLPDYRQRIALLKQSPAIKVPEPK